jgi:imidazolonepropionase-like amidohydrolase
MVAATLGQGARAADGKSPGTRPKMIALLRAELIRAQDYLRKKETAEKGKEPEPSLRSEALVPVLKGERPLLVTVQRASDILTALRVADEFRIKVVLDGAAEAQAVLDPIRNAGVGVIVHPTMARHGGQLENASFETASVLKHAGIPIALQTGFEGYVPKVRVLLFEAAAAAANGLGMEGALAASTIDPAKILGIADRVGSLEAGKDGDLALFDGDPFEYATRCTGVVIEGEVMSRDAR